MNTVNEAFDSQNVDDDNRLFQPCNNPNSSNSTIPNQIETLDNLSSSKPENNNSIEVDDSLKSEQPIPSLKYPHRDMNKSQSSEIELSIPNSQSKTSENLGRGSFSSLFSDTTSIRPTAASLSSSSGGITLSNPTATLTSNISHLQRQLGGSPSRINEIVQVQNQPQQEKESSSNILHPSSASSGRFLKIQTTPRVHPQPDLFDSCKGYFIPQGILPQRLKLLQSLFQSNGGQLSLELIHKPIVSANFNSINSISGDKSNLESIESLESLESESSQDLWFTKKHSVPKQESLKPLLKSINSTDTSDSGTLYVFTGLETFEAAFQYLPENFTQKSFILLNVDWITDSLSQKRQADILMYKKFPSVVDDVQNIQNTQNASIPNQNDLFQLNNKIPNRDSFDPPNQISFQNSQNSKDSFDQSLDDSRMRFKRDLQLYQPLPKKRNTDVSVPLPSSKLSPPLEESRHVDLSVTPYPNSTTIPFEKLYLYGTFFDYNDSEWSRMCGYQTQTENYCPSTPFGWDQVMKNKDSKGHNIIPKNRFFELSGEPVGENFITNTQNFPKVPILPDINSETEYQQTLKQLKASLGHRKKWTPTEKMLFYQTKTIPKLACQAHVDPQGNATGGNPLQVHGIQANVENPNSQLVEMFNSLATLRKSSGEKYNQIVYERAAKQIKSLKHKLTHISQIENLKGIGPKVRSKIEEYLATGEIQALANVPDFMKYEQLFIKVNGCGPVVARKWALLGLKSIQDILEKDAKSLGVSPQVFMSMSVEQLENMILKKNQKSANGTSKLNKSDSPKYPSGSSSQYSSQYSSSESLLNSSDKSTPIALFSVQEINQRLKEWHDQHMSGFLNANIVPFLSHQQRIGIRYFKEINSRLPRSAIYKIEVIIRKILFAMCPRARMIVCGSYRRGKLTCGDIDILITSRDGSHKGHLLPLIFELHKRRHIVDHLMFAERKYFGMFQISPEYPPFRIDLFTIPWSQFPTGLMAFTGSGHFNRSMRFFAKKTGFHLSEKVLEKVERNQHGTVTKILERYELHSEFDIFFKLNLSYLPPGLRNV